MGEMKIAFNCCLIAGILTKTFFEMFGEQSIRQA